MSVRLERTPAGGTRVEGRLHLLLIASALRFILILLAIAAWSVFHPGPWSYVLVATALIAEGWMIWYSWECLTRFLRETLETEDTTGAQLRRAW